jgi:Transglycosylase SLT domain
VQIAAVGRHVQVAVGGSRRLAATHVVVHGLNPLGKDAGATRPGSPRRFDPDRQRRPFGRRRLSLFGLAVAAVVVVGAVAMGVGGRGGGEAVRYVPRGELRSDPLAFTDDRASGFERAAANGLSQVIYAKSPGGVLAAAARTASFRPLVERATAGTGIDPNLVEAIVMLESAGRPDAIAGGDPAGAAGLTQIVAGTASSFLGMRVEIAASRELTSRIERARARGKVARALRLEAARRAIDARFDPAEALAGTVRYLSAARARFGRDDLAVVSYHMGIGNLESVLGDYTGAPAGEPIGAIVRADGLSYARVFFDSSPVDHTAAWRRLAAFGDDSKTYYWRVLAAEQIMRLYRRDPVRLEALAYLHERKASAEEVLHPLPVTERFLTPDAVERARRQGLLQTLPDDPKLTHFRVDPRLGEFAQQLGRSPALYRALRPEALALLCYLAGNVHTISGSGTPLIVTSAVRDASYQRLLSQVNPEATDAYSLHTTGYAFDLLRRYGSSAEARALQYELDRLEALNLIAWVREPSAIHVTVSSRAAELIPATLRRVS